MSSTQFAKSASAEASWRSPSLLSDEHLETEICSLASRLAAMTCRMLLLIAEMDRRESWGAWGIRSCAHWLSWQCGFSLKTAREHVRVASVLPGLPHVVDLFEKGELSYAKVRAITRVATPENEQLLVSYAKEATASQLERIVRGIRRATETEEEDQAYDQRGVCWAEDGPTQVLTIRMTREERAVIEKAQAKARESASAEASDPVGAYLAMAETLLASGPRRAKDRYLVNLNVSAETLAQDAQGECDLDGHEIAPETARRLSCDAPVVLSLIDGDGVVLKMGRKTRLFKGPIRKAVLKRDKGTCRFPGCDNRRYIDVHHILHWTKGGLTNPENGVVLCDFHHRLVHEGGFSLDTSLVFRNPRGEVVPDIPVPVRATKHSSDLGHVDRLACVSAGNGAPFNVDWAVMSVLN